MWRKNALPTTPCIWLCVGLMVWQMCVPWLYAQQSVDSTQQLLELPLEDIFNTSFVSASNKTERLFETPLSATVLTAEEIKRSGATSIPEALRLAPGLIVREQTPGNYDVHIRGFDAIDPGSFLYETANTISLVMIDYRPVYDEEQGNTRWENLPVGIEDIDRIEIIRGPAPAGMPNPASGVIHIITKKPLSLPEGISAGVTAYTTPSDFGNIVSTSVGYNYDSRAAIRLNGNYEHRRRHKTDYWYFTRRALPFVHPQEEAGGYVDMPFDSALNFGGFRFGEFITLPGQKKGDISNSYPNPELALHKYTMGANMEVQLSELNIRSAVGYSSVRKQNVYAENLAFALSTDSSTEYFSRITAQWKDIKASVDYAKLKRDVLGIPVIAMSSQVVNSSLEYNSQPLDNLQVQAGLSYRRTEVFGYPFGTDTLRFSDNTVQPGLEPPVNQVAALYARADYTWNAFRCIAAARVEKYAKPDILNINPQLIATYTPADDIALRASFTRGARSPFMINVFLHSNVSLTLPDSIDFAGRKVSFATRVESRGSSDQKLMTIDNLEVGARWKVSGQVMLDAEAYSMKLSNPTVQVLDTVYYDFSELDRNRIINYQSLVYRTLNYTARMFGGTLTATYKPLSGISVNAFISAQTTTLEHYYFRDPITSAFIGNDTTMKHKATPSYYGGADVNYEPLSGWNINLNTYFYAKQEISTRYDKAEIPANFLLNIATSYEVTNTIKLFINVRNLLGGGKRQFGMADQIDTYLLGGIQAEL